MPGPVLVSGTAGNDTLIVTALTVDTGLYSLNGGPLIGFSGAASFTFNGLAGDDTFTLQNPSGSLFAPLGGIFFDGGGQAGDTFNNFGGAATFGTYSAAASSGVLQQNLGSLTQTITLTNLGSTPVTDLVSDVFLTVFGTLGPGDQRNGRRNRRRCADDAVQQSDLHQLPRRQ